jgi:hypothetical protein
MNDHEQEYVEVYVGGMDKPVYLCLNCFGWFNLADQCHQVKLPALKFPLEKGVRGLF